MAIIKYGLILGAAIMLLPTDERKQSELRGVAVSTVENTVTFCERNPGTCAAGHEMWALFLHKAEFGMELASNIIRKQIARSYAGAPAPQDADWRQAQPEPMARNHVRIEPVDVRNALTRSDRAAQWRGVQPAGAR